MADDKGPYLILAAFWLADDETERVADAVREADFPTPDGWPRGAVVAFRREVATSWRFLHDLGRFDLEELAAIPQGEGLAEGTAPT